MLVPLILLGIGFLVISIPIYIVLKGEGWST